MIRRFAVAALLLLPLAGCGDGTTPVDVTAPHNTQKLTITTGNGTVRHFAVEVARTSAEQARGLMFRTTLPADGGMLFPMEPARVVSFWMKDTALALDIVFIRPDRTIALIVADAVPYSLQPIESGEPVAAVLEIGAGRAAALGLAAGDSVRWGDDAAPR